MAERGFEVAAHPLDIEGESVPDLEAEVVDHHSRAALRIDRVGALLDDPEPHMLEHRQHVR